MDNVYEIVFEGVSKHDLYDFIRYIEMSAKSYTGLGVEGAEGDKEQVEMFLSSSADTRLIEKLFFFKVFDDVCLPCAWLSVLKYGAIVDVELSFYGPSSIEIDRFMRSMQRYAAAAAEKFCIKSFYGGLEPAQDLNTRYFTGNYFGPLGRLSY